MQGTTKQVACQLLVTHPLTPQRNDRIYSKEWKPWRANNPTRLSERPSASLCDALRHASHM